MQKKNVFFCGCSLLGIILTLLFIASCSMDGGDIKPLPAEGTQSGGRTLVIRANVSTERQRNDSARSAVPSAFKGADGAPLVFAGALYKEGDLGTDRNFKGAAYKDGTVTLSIEIEKLSDGAEVERTLEIRAYKSGTKDFSDSPLLSGAASISIGASAVEVSAPQITLKPHADSDEKGKVNLAILIPSEYVLSVVCNSGSKAAFTTTEVEAIGGGYKKYALTADGVTQGVYEVNFQLKTSDDAEDDSIAYLWSEPINVFPGMTTDKWNDDAGEVENGARKVSGVRIFSTFYVAGEGPSSDWFKANPPQSDGTGNGSLSHPYTNIQDAIDRVIAINDGSTPFAIYVDGELTLKKKDTQLALIGTSDKNLNLKIQALSGKATLNAKQNGRVMTINAPANASADKKYAIALKNLVITGGKHADNGSGIYIDGSGDIALENCEIRGNLAGNNGGGVYLVGGSFTMNSGEIAGNTAATGAGAYILGGSAFLMSGAAHFAEGNDIYLCDDTTIQIAGALTAETPVATITPSSYPNDMDAKNVLSADGTNVKEITSDICAKFVITPQAAANADSIEWRVTPSDDKKNGILMVKVTAEYYVQGINGTYMANDANPGTRMKPFATIQRAIDIIQGNLVNDDASDYTIFVDGTLTLKSSMEQMANIVGANDKNLNLKIQALSDKATLDAGQNGRVMTIQTASAGRRYNITLENLVITGGKHNERGGGIYLNGSGNSLTLINCDVKGNDGGKDGGGIFISQGSSLTMNGGTVVGSTDADGNKAENGAGVYVASKGSLTMNDGAGINRNSATGNGGGVVVYQGGVVAIHNGTISFNTAKSGAGIHSEGGVVAVNGGAKVVNNSGTGICATGAEDGSSGTRLTMEAGAVVSGNTATTDGGGILVNNGSVFTMNGGTIGATAGFGGNTTQKRVDGVYVGRGGGVYVGRNGRFIMNGGDIIGNQATMYGGGVYVTADDKGKGTFEMNGGTIMNNTADGSGNGVYVATNGTFSIDGAAKVEGNNDVYLSASDSNAAKVQVAGALSESPVATITPTASLYTTGTEVLVADAGVTITQDVCDRFVITPKSDGTEWKIAPNADGSKGVLQPK